MHLNISSAKWQTFCLGGDELKPCLPSAIDPGIVCCPLWLLSQDTSVGHKDIHVITRLLINCRTSLTWSHRQCPSRSSTTHFRGSHVLPGWRLAALAWHGTGIMTGISVLLEPCTHCPAGQPGGHLARAMTVSGVHRHISITDSSWHGWNSANVVGIESQGQDAFIRIY